MYKKINLNEALKLQREGAVIIDVKTKEEYLKKHITGALNIPVKEIINVLDIIKDKNKIIILYCQTGKRSYMAAKSLLSLGYNNVYDLGIFN